MLSFMFYALSSGGQRDDDYYDCVMLAAPPVVGVDILLFFIGYISSALLGN